MAIQDVGVLYVRDNSTATSQDTLAAVLGSVGWSAITAWAASTAIAPGSIRRQTAGQAVFTASRATTTLTVTAMTSGTIYLGMELSTVANTNRCTVTALGTGTGGTGTYTVSVSGTIASTTWNGNFIQGAQLAFIATQSATQNTGATEPNWSTGGTSRGGTFTDGSVTWTECTGAPGVNNDFTNTPNWTFVKNTAPGRGSIIKDNAGTHLFIQTSSGGTAGNGAEPSWNTAAVGQTTTDNTVTWCYIGTSFGAWAAPLATITQGSTWVSTIPNAVDVNLVGHLFYVGDDHNEQYGNNATIAPTNINHTNPAQILSIDHTSTSRPPVSADLKAGATASTIGGTSAAPSATNAYWYGWTFNSGIGSSANIIPQVLGTAVFEACTFKLSTTGSTARLIFGGANYRTIFNNCSVYFSNAGQTFEFDGGELLWKNSTILASGSTVPTIFALGTGQGENVFEGCDFTGITGTLIPAGTSSSFVCRFTFIDCKFDASLATIAATPVDLFWPVTDVVRCSFADSKTYVQRRYLSVGTLSEEATIIRTGGATDNVTGISWKIATTATIYYWAPFEAFPVMIWNPTTGSDVIVTLHGIWNSASLPNNDEIWVEVEYLGDTTPTPLGKYKSGSKTNVVASGSAQAADSTSAWDSLVTARANTHAYSLGDVYKSANNAGRIFFVTTAGTSAGSEPGGIATAVDGGLVTDGTAVVRAGTRFTLTVTLTSTQPQLAGYLKAQVKAAKVSSTFYVDPTITLS